MGILPNRLHIFSRFSCAPKHLTIFYYYFFLKHTIVPSPQVEMVYSLLSMLGTHDKDDMSRTLLAMSSSQDSCIAMRQSGCLPLLIQLLHGNDKDSVLLGNSRGSKEARARASAALHNIIHSQPDDKRGRREIRVLHLLEQIRAYCETCWEWQESHERGVDQDKNPSKPGFWVFSPYILLLYQLQISLWFKGRYCPNRATK